VTAQPYLAKNPAGALSRSFPVAETITRILSDVHYGDHSSRVRSLDQLLPLTAGVGHLVLNGDMLDTRQGPNPAHTEACRAEVGRFIGRAGVPVTFLTGNHDPDFSDRHTLELAQGQVFVIHGDILFDSITPWGHDAEPIQQSVRAALAALPPGAAQVLEERIRVFRRVAGSVRQRHQAERHLFKYVYRFVTDTIWPPHSALSMLHAWRDVPGLAAALARQHRPRAKFIVIGHTHRPGIWSTAGGATVINTGSFGLPFGGQAVDVTERRLTVRRLRMRQGAFHAGPVVAEFALAEAEAMPHQDRA
jgi:predicted phosphodiesterase